MSGNIYFSKLDCVDSFWQVPLDKESQPLTKFVTPWGRYCFQRLTIGLSSASEHFQGFPESPNKLSPQAKTFWGVRHELTVQGDLLLYQSRIVVPQAARSDILDKLHQGHMGITKARNLAHQTVYWPGLSEAIKQKCPLRLILHGPTLSKRNVAPYVVTVITWCPYRHQLHRLCLLRKDEAQVLPDSPQQAVVDHQAVYCVATVVPNAMMAWGDDPTGPCGTASLMSIGKLGVEQNKKHAAALHSHCEKYLGIPKDK
ncbi:hypothetical protein B566_EDAN017855 [Ephemera danica]|nr:hypothetical protein B566_EDAN017855 [Ephemera danica]